MRFIAFLFLLSCSHDAPLKYKYSYSKRYLASLTRDEVVVEKIEGHVQNPLIFASGMDSTFLFVKLYDEKGNLLTDVDPTDLTLSTSVDVEAKPFTLKQGIYKAEILPRAKSKDIRIRVDWKERILSQEIFLKSSLAPIKAELELKKDGGFQTIGLGFGRSSSDPTEGFSFENSGHNRIVPTKKNSYLQRSFTFSYPEQARQNIALEVFDVPNKLDSHTMNSVFMFFPRKNMPIQEEMSGVISVTLPTGEKMIFQKDSKEVTEGVFAEGPLDSSRNHLKRRYPDLRYQGRGVVLRANARGRSPQLGEFESDQIDLEYGSKGSVDVLIINGSTGQRCRRPKEDFWEPLDVSPIEFKFPNDEDFDSYLKKVCGFGLPKF